MFTFLKKNRIVSVVVALIVISLIIIIFTNSNKNNNSIQYTATTKDISSTLVLSGKVEPVDKVDLAFVSSGLVGNVFKQSGDIVKSGEKIVELDNSSLLAQLANAKANLDLQKAQAGISSGGSLSVQENVDLVTKQQDLLVANAYKKLLTDDLAAYSVNGDEDVSATVSGTYDSTQAGDYDLKTYPSGSDSGLSLYISGLESGTTNLSFNSPSPIGTRGLYIKFSQTGTSYSNSEWIISIPNKRGSHYTDNLNAYQSALRTKDIEIAKATSDITGNQSQIRDAKIAQAQADVNKIWADINNRILSAPFNGVVSRIDIKKGEIATPDTVVATVISKDNYQVTVQVPEVDIVNMTSGLKAEITLDAYGKEVIFPATVLSVDQSETKVDGVSVYEAKVLFDNSDERILSGMTATVTILKQKKENVLSVPASFIQTDDKGKYVMLLNEKEESVKTYIITGITGDNSDVEVISGIKQGDVLIGNFKTE